MNYIFRCSVLFLLLLSGGKIHSQEIIAPSSSIISRDYLQNNKFSMKLYIVNGTSKVGMGKLTITTQVDSLNQKLNLIFLTTFDGLPYETLDSSVLNLKNLSPIYFSSRGMGEETILNFEKNKVSGTWTTFNRPFEVKDSTKPPFFDYHSLPVLVSLLTFEKGENYELPVYDYIVGRNGMTKISVSKVEAIDLNGKKALKITVNEHIRKITSSVFFIDASTHELLQVDFEKDGKKSQMLRMEISTI